MPSFPKIARNFIIFCLGSFLVLTAGMSGLLWVQGKLLTLDDIGELILRQPLLVVLPLLGLSVLGITLTAMFLRRYPALFQRSKKKFNPEQQATIDRKLQEARSLMQQGSPSSYRSAITAMDATLDFCLGILGYSGSLGEKLQKAEREFTDINRVWQAHKYRNRLVHDIHYEPIRTEAEENMRRFEQALRELRALA